MTFSLPSPGLPGISDTPITILSLIVMGWFGIPISISCTLPSKPFKGLPIKITLEYRFAEIFTFASTLPPTGTEVLGTRIANVSSPLNCVFSMPSSPVMIVPTG